MKELQGSVEDITQELYELDEKEREMKISQKYRDTRKEIVRVIQAINHTEDQVSSMLKKITVYKKQIFLSQKELKETKKELEKTKSIYARFHQFYVQKDQSLYSTNDKIDELNCCKSWFIYSLFETKRW